MRTECTSPRHPVFKPPAGLTLKQVIDWTAPGFYAEPLKKKKLRVGEVLIVQIRQEGLFIGTVSATPDGDPIFTSSEGALIGILEFNPDNGLWEFSPTVGIAP